MPVPFSIASDAINRPHLSDVSPWRIRFRTIYESLRTDITLLRYPPGAIMDISLLARQFGVSRTPIRTVIQRLENEGLTITKHGVGTIVTEIDFSQVRQAMELRMCLAEAMGSLDPRPPNDTIEEKLGSLLSEFTNLENEASLTDFARLDMVLHNCKCELIGNDLLRRSYDELYYRTARIWFQYLPKLTWKSEAESLRRDYQQTLEAVRRNDVTAVGFITRNAVSEALYRINNLID